MNTKPLKDFEEKFEQFIRLWMRYFFNIEEFILPIEILLDQKGCMLQRDILKRYGSDGRRDRIKVLEDLYACYILEKKENIKLLKSDTQADLKEKELNKDNPKDKQKVQKDQTRNARDQEMFVKDKLANTIKETHEQRNQKYDAITIWGFDFENLHKYKEFLKKMKEESEVQIQKNNTEIDSTREDQLFEENKQLTQFVDKYLEAIEAQLDIVLEAESKTDTTKSMYNANNYDKQIVEERDQSKTFQIASENLQVKQYVRLQQYCQDNPMLFSPTYIYKPQVIDIQISTNQIEPVIYKEQSMIDEYDSLQFESISERRRNKRKIL